MKTKRGSRPATERRLLYGVNPLIEALRADQLPSEIVIAEGSRDARLRELIELAEARHVPVKHAPRARLDREVPNGRHQGVIAHTTPAAYADADELLESIASRVGSEREPLAVLLDGIEDPRNLGAILRTAECAGVAGVFIPERRAAGLNETVAKASAGAVAHLPVGRATNLSRLIEQLKERNVWVVGAATEGKINYTDWDWTRATALVLGAEGSGLHRLVREHCDALVRIPVQGKIESLNVSVAAGVILYEAVRQRRVAENSETLMPRLSF
ncbi:MAG TPA: 23S rRNA (guanosine(2251)-2'-O)-methyltransferase RlmB [Pyrinomonadaceae bacterium]|nr:23S rRNA (guanosine(2251)-2'-O)-methyltransferase RlmB [Pyrinomonadaceae bacterium]